MIKKGKVKIINKKNKRKSPPKIVRKIKKKQRPIVAIAYPS